jgi:hypothetical protein
MMPPASCWPSRSPSAPARPSCPHLASNDHRTGAPDRTGRRDPARHGQRQRRPGRRPGPGRCRDRALGCPAGLRPHRRGRRCAGRGAAGLAPSTRHPRRAGAVPARPGHRWPVRATRAGRPADPAALRRVHGARLRRVGAPAADRHPPTGSRPTATGCSSRPSASAPSSPP